MHLISVTLQNFRSYSKKSFSFSPKTNLIIGPNGSGKTNLLEAISLLSAGKSFRSVSLAKLISWNQTFALVQGHLHNSDDNPKLEVQLVQKPDSPTVSRQYLIQKVTKTRKSFLGTIKTVVFSPQDIRLTTGSPSRRRDFINSVFTSTNWRYAQSLTQYNKALAHRNELLDQIRQGKNSKKELFYWDQSLIKNDLIIHQYRSSFIQFANHFFANNSHSEIKKIFLNPQVSLVNQPTLDKNYLSDLARGYTQIGNHRDDFSFDSHSFPGSDKNLANWGSRGQQRLAVLALRLAQIDFIKTSQKQIPVLLLDDIFSELDADHQKLVTNICRNYQTIFTSAEPDTFKLLPDAKIINL